MTTSACLRLTVEISTLEVKNSVACKARPKPVIDFIWRSMDGLRGKGEGQSDDLERRGEGGSVIAAEGEVEVDAVLNALVSHIDEVGAGIGGAALSFEVVEERGTTVDAEGDII